MGLRSKLLLQALRNKCIFVTVEVNNLDVLWGVQYNNFVLLCPLYTYF